MKKLGLIVAKVTIVFLSLNIVAQEKYAVIITGDYEPSISVIPLNEQWNSGYGQSDFGYDEFWNDTYLFWEMLILEKTLGGKEYPPENVNVLFANGFDYNLYFSGIDERYDASQSYPQYYPITNNSSTLSSISNLLTNTLSVITEDDFLFVWIMSHGGTDANGSYFYSYDAQKIYDTQLATWLNGINAHKKTVFLSCPSSGGFTNELEGDRTIVITGSQMNESASRADNMSPGGVFTENEMLGTNTYNHGEFNYHLFSSLSGKTPSGETTYGAGNTPLIDSNLNNDDYISVGESKTWDINQSTTTESQGFSDISGIVDYTDLEIPTILHGTINQDMLIRGIVGNTKNEPAFTSGTTVTFDGVINIIELLNTTLYFNPGSTTIIKDNCELNIHGDLPYIKGLLDFGDFVTINSNMGLALAQENNAQINHMSFEKGILALYKNVLTIDNSLFQTGTKIKYYPTDLTVLRTTFYRSIIDLADPSHDFSKVIIDGCVFQGKNPYWQQASIGLQNYESYSIINCILNDVVHDAIHLSHCGITPMYGVPKLIENDSICWNEAGTAITLNSTHCDIKNNNIIRNKKGIFSYNKSQVRIEGNKQAVNVHETQQIWSNDFHQIYATSEYSFPYYVKWNYIRNLPGYFDTYIATSYCNKQLDITYNYWGSGFDPDHPENYFSPISCFNWEPYWSLSESGEIALENDEQLYNSANEKIEQEDYDGSESEFINLINTYPDSKFSEEALKNLFVLQQETSNDYQELQSYYLTDNTIQNNGNLKKLAESLAIYCDIILEDYQTALNNYYNLLDDSISYNDSLIALINIEYVNFLIDNNSSYKSSDDFMINDILNPNNDYNEKINKYEYLFFNPAKKGFEKSLALLSSGQLLQNFPNPATNTTKIYYKLSKPANIVIKIFNYSGQLINTFNEGLKPEGTHHIIADASYLLSGIYYYNIEVNGIITDTKKMVVHN